MIGDHLRVTGAAVVVVLVGCGGSSGGASSSQSSHQISSAGVSLTVPAGWQERPNGQAGIVLAPDASGLAAAVPTGPRFTATPATGGLPGPKTLARLVAGAPRDIKLVAPVQTLAVGGSKGVAITVQEPRDGRSIVSEQVTVPLGQGRAYTFLLEAPASSWGSNQQALMAILDSVSFNLSAVPIARGGTPGP